MSRIRPSAPPAPAPLDVVVVLTDDNLASTAIGPIEVFGAAGVLWQTLLGEPIKPRCNVTVATVDGAPVTAVYPLRIAPQCAIADVERADVVIVSASGMDLDAQLKRNAALLSWLRDMHAHGAWLGAVCSGAAWLAEAGLLDGRRATTHWAVADAYRRRYPAVDWRPELFITEDQRVLCSGGVYGALDLSLYLVNKFCGREIALQCARTLLVGMPRVFQSEYALLPLSRPHTDTRIRDVEDYIAAHFAENITIERLAEHAHMSTRTFQRRFKTATGRLPADYVQAQRIAVARDLLEQGSLTVQQVSAEIGYDDVASFRRVFRRMTGMTPGQYRERFGSALHNGAAQH